LQGKKQIAKLTGSVLSEEVIGRRGQFKMNCRHPQSLEVLQAAAGRI